MIINRLYPEHLDEIFCDIYLEIYQQRKKAKKEKDGITDAALKLAMNGCFGKFNDKHSWLFDPKTLLQVTLNGQLLLTMLAEQLSKISLILQCNTDGVTVRIKKDKINEMNRIIKWWEDLTQLELEDAHYSKMIIRDVNSYMALYTNGEVKYKGAFEIDKEMKGDLLYHKDHSKRIVPLAVSLYFTHGIPVRETIENHFNHGDYYDGKIKNHGIFDFCLAKKTKGGKKGRPKMITREIINGKIIETQLQKTNRYYISNKGVHFIKKYPDGSEAQVESHPQKGRYYKAKIFNKYEKLDEYNIDYNYYTREANKLINSIVDFNYSLF